MTILVTGKQEGLVPAPGKVGRKQSLTAPWKLSFCSGKEYPNFGETMELQELVNVAKLKPDFSGYMAYETEFDLPHLDGRVSLCLEQVFEGAQVWVNGTEAGMLLAPPYDFDLTDLVHSGRNTLRIEVANTFDRYMRKHHRVMGAIGGGNAPVEPAGLFGEVALYLE